MNDNVLTIENVEESDNMFFIRMSDGWSFGFEKKHGVIPVIGDSIKIYTASGIGSPIRGVDLNGKPVYYKSDEQLEQERQEWLDNNSKEKQEEFNKNRATMDLDYLMLPENFKLRIDRFRNNNPDFRVNYESYELFCCKEAVKIAKACETPEKVKEFRDGKSYLVPNLDDGHSGNTFGCACSLAYLHLTNPEFVYKQHGALSPLVGSEEYGDVPKEE